MRAFAPTDMVATGIVLMLAVGLAMRRNRKVHPPLMGLCFVLDLGLVLYLELTRGAVNTAVTTDSRILTFHVAVAVATIVLYLVLVPSGYKLLKGGGNRGLHRKAALAFVVCRVLTYLTAFLIPRSV